MPDNSIFQKAFEQSQPIFVTKRVIIIHSLKCMAPQGCGFVLADVAGRLLPVL